MRFVSLWLAGIALTLMSVTCGRDCKTKPATLIYTLSAAEKKALPYTGRDTLRFLRNGTDTIVMIGNGQDSGWRQEKDFNGTCPYVRSQTAIQTYLYGDTVRKVYLYVEHNARNESAGDADTRLLFSTASVLARAGANALLAQPQSSQKVILGKNYDRVSSLAVDSAGQYAFYDPRFGLLEFGNSSIRFERLP